MVLGFEIKTTQTAANVFWGYWSHDIGGFHDGKGAPGDHDPANVTGSELLLRWLQFGVVAPILRTHCDHCERRIWEFPFFFLQMRDAMLLRNALGPYIYTEARGFFDSGVAPVHPVYYEDPADAQLYAPQWVETQFMHGDRILAAPITLMTGAVNGVLPSWSTYLPGGARWSNFNGTQVWQGPATVTLPYGVGDIPLFVRGGILPMKTLSSISGDFPDPLVWVLFPGSRSGNYTVYEDSGDSNAYVGGEFVSTTAAFLGDPGDAQGSLSFTVGQAESATALPAGFPQARSHVLQVRGLRGRTPVAVTVDGQAVPQGEGTPGWSVAQTHSLVEPLGALTVRVGPQGSWVGFTVNVSY